MLSLKNFLRRKLDNEYIRNQFVERELNALKNNSLLLDAGCGSQQYRKFCGHLRYRSQDFCQYESDALSGFTSGMGGSSGYIYGNVDYVGDIWAIDECNAEFDAILCTEVFEHIPFPNETLSEFSRLLKTDGVLILTVPSNCLRHMDPFFYYSGFSDRYLERMLPENGFHIEILEPIGDYYSWLAVEIARTIKNHSIFAMFLLLPALFYFYCKSKSVLSVNTLCMGYHVVAKKI